MTKHGTESASGCRLDREASDMILDRKGVTLSTKICYDFGWMVEAKGPSPFHIVIQDY